MRVKLVLRGQYEQNPFFSKGEADLCIFDEERSREGEQRHYYLFKQLTIPSGYSFATEPINLIEAMNDFLRTFSESSCYCGKFVDGHHWEAEILDELLLTDIYHSVRWFAATRNAPYYIIRKGPPSES